MRFKERERESTMGCRGSDNAWIENQVRLKALLVAGKARAIIYTSKRTHKSSGACPKA